MRLDVTKNLKTIKNIDKTLDNKPFLDEIAVDAEKDILDNIETEGRNLGLKWRSGRAESDNGLSLVDTGQMRASIKGRRHVGDFVTVKTNRKTQVPMKGSDGKMRPGGTTNTDIVEDLQRRGYPFFQFSWEAKRGFIETIDDAIKT